MELRPRAEQQWIVQPLIDAGVDLDEIGQLVSRLAFTAIVTEGCGALASLAELVADRPAEVQAAWCQVITRMLVLDGPP
ncbi:hypothetical protein [Modestobacter italicus]|uniref:hypothetical protein n=1 Tax=Modestobacter italicus (strain DSM 44449 / CECT 9708 / BC 501) TaxID=2732864 RepID=UPI001C988C4E|nr:hypothetical protein [Modestobacter italicus]